MPGRCPPPRARVRPGPGAAPRGSAAWGGGSTTLPTAGLGPRLSPGQGQGQGMLQGGHPQFWPMGASSPGPLAAGRCTLPGPCQPRGLGPGSSTSLGHAQERSRAWPLLLLRKAGRDARPRARGRVSREEPAQAGEAGPGQGPGHKQPLAGRQQRPSCRQRDWPSTHRCGTRGPCPAWWALAWGRAGQHGRGPLQNPLWRAQRARALGTGPSQEQDGASPGIWKARPGRAKAESVPARPVGAHQRALWSLMKAVLSLCASASSPSESDGASCHTSAGSPL